jgi:hypothetical protein
MFRLSKLYSCDLCLELENEEILETKSDEDDTIIQSSTTNQATSAKKSKSSKKKKKKEGASKIESDYKFVDDLSLLNLANPSPMEAKQESFSSLTNNLIERDLLQIEAKHLSSEYEMVRRFGAKVVNADKQHGSNRSNNKRNASGLATKRFNCLVNKKPTWPVFYRNGLQMQSLANQRNDIVDFTFEHLRDYQHIQFDFLDAVDTMDHNHIVVSSFA